MAHQFYGEVIGYGSTADAYRITDIHPEGRGAISCMKMALEDARLNPEQINYVNAHGTSTTVNDKVESKACREVFGQYAMDVPVSSTKSMMGHLIAAAGATELIMCLLAIRDNVLPPTINYENPDPDCAIWTTFPIKRVKPNAISHLTTASVSAARISRSLRPVSPDDFSVLAVFRNHAPYPTKKGHPFRWPISSGGRLLRSSATTFSRRGRACYEG